MSGYRVIDRREHDRPGDAEFVRSIGERPFEVQVRVGSGWCTIPGAYYATRAEAEVGRGRGEVGGPGCAENRDAVAVGDDVQQ